MVGDQQASLAGQGCFFPGDAKVTLGTGAMLDITLGSRPPSLERRSWRSDDGTYSIVAWDVPDDRRFGAEGIVLSAGDSVAWAAELGLLDSPHDAERVARLVESTEGVRFVPALSGLGSPRFDFGARGTFVGLTLGSTAAHLVRAVLEGIAHSVTDAVEAAGVKAQALRVDGGAANNTLLLQTMADLTGLSIERAPLTDATSLGAALWAGVATGIWGSPEEAASVWPPAERVTPSGIDARPAREAWAEAVHAAIGWVPELSSLPL
jgi:glycerol kinase